MKLPRLTLGWMIAVVAVAAIPIARWSMDLRSRRQDYLEGAVHHERREAEEKRYFAGFDEARRRATQLDQPALDIEKTSRLRAKYHAAMRQEYLRVARYPWQDVGADPGEPGGSPVPPTTLIAPIEFPDFTERLNELTERLNALP